jgi:hypothetical protein
MPLDYGTTPGGTMFGTTPGGTRIIYDRAFLLECRNSPLAQSPLANLPRIPGVTCPAERGSSGSPKGGLSGGEMSPLAKKPPARLGGIEQKAGEEENLKKAGEASEDPQFDMDI